MRNRDSLRARLRREIIRRGLYTPCCASCGELPALPGMSLCSSLPARLQETAAIAPGEGGVRAASGSAKRRAGLFSTAAAPFFVWDVVQSIRAALVRGIPLFDGCACCPDSFPWQERRSGLPAPDFPVDFVFTWVDGDDPALAAKRALYAKNDSAAEGPSRFRDNGELRYALRSLEIYAPWVNRVFIVSDGQVPAWLNIRHPRIRVVDHTECIPAAFLPTFSSRVIEAHVHRIPGLAEHYVYCNDDFFLLSPCLPQDFFTAGGLPYFFVDWRRSRRKGYARATPHAASYANTRAFMEQKGLAPAPDVITAHVPYPQSRSNSIAAYAFYEEAIREFGHKRFRDHTGMVFTCHAAPLWAYDAERSVPCDMPYYYMNCRRYDRKVYYDAMLREKDKGTLPLFLCINDAGAAKTQNWKEDMLGFLESYYLKPSTFELKGRHGPRET